MSNELDKHKEHNPNVVSSSNGKMVFELFPQEYIELQKELMSPYHPKLQAIIAGYPMDALDVKLAQVAAYTEVKLEGIYTLADRIKLCKLLKERLILRREDPDASKIILLS